MLHLHSVLRWIILLVALWAIIKMAAGRSGDKAFAPSDKKPALFFLIFMDLQLLVGLYLYFAGAWGLKNIQNQGFGNIMKDAMSRFFAVEHLAGMLIAVILVHIGYSATKKKESTDKQKFNKAFWCFLLALIVILASIPWPFREALGRGWMPH
jgi:membrane protein DedA with SNARE-associated domain